ncbi:DPCD family protein [Toxoplasma gondii ME49]|uniref:Protein DPCD n=14 Tax=Toxoplasma gondii TaxID=5811 RepID=A0A125YRH4_TOXGV|nr:DPCD family protein [Toxoplasma gondii ME49]EPR60049.1 DPCD family protein [Toxoplasma gondii GT1]ESS31220.1 DPCD family protein [Toxoplasma gondii VEG]KAF4639996.1 DPCD family protein [Toxoplasma gondii]KFG36100.1 DPCD family protein [Toxoplasma gondii GAB2-2007-GAL-DOM2]KFG41360.1 DPCD family protein [Toxoplasma gondii p89]KFG52852.1 DPCD family protein [Toxoplasma gondii FOU]KFG62157.1 DPCD family protein [Toxoplasma gondii RUB]KFH07973.1 DPCD family protein [Toxoplasma gondii VAND]K|eukprot:XP_018635694.1 DPCD family protein [Toxoplasma gondii ME49]
MSVFQKAENGPIDTGKPQILSFIADGRRTVHTTYPDKSEKVEEYDLRDDTVLVRKFRRPPALFGQEGMWEYEIGAPRQGMDAVVASSDRNEIVMAPSTSSPLCVMRDTKGAFEWRIRNLPYPRDTYIVQIDGDASEIVISTTNKKYYKRLRISDIHALGLQLNLESLSWTHQHNTLVVSYKKPQKVLDLERKRREEAKRTSLSVG